MLGDKTEVNFKVEPNHPGQLPRFDRQALPAKYQDHHKSAFMKLLLSKLWPVLQALSVFRC